MSGKKQMVKVFGSIAVAASVAVVGARTAHAAPFITDTLGGNGHPAQTPGPYIGTLDVNVPQGYRLITDTLGGNGRASYNANAYVEGGASQALAKAIQTFGRAEQSPAAAPSVAPSPGDSASSWRNVGIGAGSAACLMLLLACGLLLRSNRHRVAAA